MSDVKIVCLPFFSINDNVGEANQSKRKKTWNAGGRRKKKEILGIVEVTLGVKQIEVMNINSQKPIAFLSPSPCSLFPRLLHSKNSLLAFILCSTAMSSAQHEPLASFAAFLCTMVAVGTN
jgi:hypothetical protein